jgi:hypothetical protein
MKQSRPAEPHVGIRYAHDGVLPGASKGSFATLLSQPVSCSLQHNASHLAIGGPEPFAILGHYSPLRQWCLGLILEGRVLCKHRPPSKHSMAAQHTLAAGIVNSKIDYFATSVNAILRFKAIKYLSNSNLSHHFCTTLILIYKVKNMPIQSSSRGFHRRLTILSVLHNAIRSPVTRKRSMFWLSW